jgi:hypothetical protein
MNMLMKRPTSGDKNKLLKFVSPVRNANIDDSTDSGISLAKQTM